MKIRSQLRDVHIKNYYDAKRTTEGAFNKMVVRIEKMAMYIPFQFKNNYSKREFSVNAIRGEA